MPGNCSEQPLFVLNETKQPKRKLLKMLDLLGREVNEPTNLQIYLYIYDNGSVERKSSLR